MIGEYVHCRIQRGGNQLVQAMRVFIMLVLAIITAGVSHAATAQTSSPPIGIVIMHGKGGMPSRHVASLASSLEDKGCLAANLEMPWSERREYDVSVIAAEKEVEEAFAALQKRGARKLFIAGHSQGGMFAMYYGGKHPVDGVIAIAPGGSVSSQAFREKLGKSVERARALIAEGKGDTKTRFDDFESSKGTYPVVATPAAYLSWFDPAGAMNMPSAVRSMPPKIPVLWIVAKNDYPPLRQINLPLFRSLPPHRFTRLYEPDSDHRGAPSASRDEIVRWLAEVATAEER